MVLGKKKWFEETTRNHIQTLDLTYKSVICACVGQRCLASLGSWALCVN